MALTLCQGSEIGWGGAGWYWAVVESLQTGFGASPQKRDQAKHKALRKMAESFGKQRKARIPRARNLTSAQKGGLERTTIV